MEEDLVLKVEDLHKYFMVGNELLRVICGIDLRVPRGSFWALVGESGVGKSTLLHILGLIDKPTRGEIFINSKPASNLSDKEAAALRNSTIGVVFQFHYLLPEFTALENLILPQLMARKDMKTARDRASYLLDEVNMGSRRNHYPNQLSGGEQQRVAFARALTNDPDIVLADEPTGNLDEQNSLVFQGIIMKMIEKLGKTFILATHDLKFSTIADRIIRLHEGSASDETGEIKRKYG
ncbi:ABC transporter ATP-binding protein [bacterium]|nr:ABC transporter ATP-binding protein [bacterium]